MIDYRVLSLWQPWATFTLPGPDGRPLKSWETRHWSFENKGGLRRLELPVPVVIHATKRFDQRFLESIPKLYALAGYPKIILGSIIGVGVVSNVVRTEGLLEHWKMRIDRGDKRLEAEVQLGDYSPGRFAWELKNVVALPNPIPFRGKQEPLYVLPAEVRDEVEAQLRAA